jgi:TRAP-type uncharacterized transport system substrate-binding protein
MLVILAGLLQFLAPEVSYQARDRVWETLSGRRGRTYRIALGARTGSNYRVGEALNRHLQTQSGYQLDLLETVLTGNVDALKNAGGVDLATINSADDEAVRADGLYGLAALELQHFFVVVANDSSVQDFRDLTGPVNPGVRDTGDPPTLGERVLEYYGMLSSGSSGAPARVTVVRPKSGNLRDLESGHNVATTRTQFLRSSLMENMLRTGEFRLLPIRDHQALATFLPGTIASVIPSGLYGPARRIPPEPIPTIAVRQLLVARADVPGRVIRDLLDVIYSPRFQRDVQYVLTEESGRNVAGLPLHPAAEIFYRRNDAMTSDRIGRLSFVASAIAGLFAISQFVSRYVRDDRKRRRRGWLDGELSRLQAIRGRIENGASRDAVRDAQREADDVLCGAERDAAMDLLDSDGIHALRSLHRVCAEVGTRRVAALTDTSLPSSTPPVAAGVPPETVNEPDPSVPGTRVP